MDSVKKSYIRNILNLRGEMEGERFFVIDDLNLFIPTGKITALIGGNGAGKTTLFNIISGFIKADSGIITYFDGQEEKLVLSLHPHRIARLGIGRLFQDAHIFPEMSILDNMLIADSSMFGENPFVSLILMNKNKEFEGMRKNKAQYIFKNLFGVDNPFWIKRCEKAKILSYGQQRLLGLSRLLMGEYKLLLLDEPTSGVSPQIIPQILRIIRKFVDEEGLTVFLIEHNMKVVLDIADFCSFMSHGKITAFGTSEDVIGNDEVRKTYLGL